MSRSGKACTEWLGDEVKRYREIAGKWLAEREMSKRDHIVLSDEWMRTVKAPIGSRNKV